MFDTREALQDMATQIRACRSEDGLTLQQLANQSGVAASTIHKVEAQQMVPTVSVFLKIARGLGRRPDQLIRDPSLAGKDDGQPPEFGIETPSRASLGRANVPRDEIGVWRIDLSAQQVLPALELAPSQRAIFLVQQGRISLQSGDRRVHVAAVNCTEFQGGTIQSPSAQLEDASVTLIVSPPGNLEGRLGTPIGLSSQCEAQAQLRPSGILQRPT
jgi:transcriptional regulator with XRE-family HTH domain